MQITADKVSLTPSSLRISCVVRGPENSWVKFAEVFVPLDVIPWEAVRQALLKDQPYGAVAELDVPLFE